MTRYLAVVVPVAVVATAAVLALAGYLMFRPAGRHHADSRASRGCKPRWHTRARLPGRRAAGPGPAPAALPEWDADTLAALHDTPTDLGPGAGHPPAPVTTATCPAADTSVKVDSPAPGILALAIARVAPVVAAARRAEVRATRPWADDTGTLTAIVKAGEQP